MAFGPTLRRRLVILAAVLAIGGCSKKEEVETPEVPLVEPEEPAKPERKEGPLLARELYLFARETVDEHDKAAFLARCEYRWADRNMLFKEAEFVFSSPAVKQKGEGNDALRIAIRNGKVVAVDEVTCENAEEIAGENMLPYRPINIALEKGLQQWWDAHPGGRVFAEVRPWEDFSYANLQGTARAVWRVRGYGPDVPVEFICYIAVGTLRFLKAETREAGGGTPKTE